MFDEALPPAGSSAPDGVCAARTAAGRRRQASRNFTRIVIGVAALLGTFGVIRASNDTRPSTGTETRTAEPKQRFEVRINRPSGPPQVATGQTNFHGQPVMASCSSCHTTTKPNVETRRSEDLDQFHQGLKYVHGDLTCLSCHNSQDYETLRLADGRQLDFSDSMSLCSQCHGPQRRDYDMGLHGGMNGHWDLTRGGRTRNTCINCHDPHSPAFPTVTPVLAPRDRISVQGKHSANATVPHP